MPESLRVAVVTESFLPSLNGVTTSVCQVLEHLRRRGHDAVVFCPGPAPSSHAGFPVVTVPAVSYRQFPVGLPSWNVAQAMAEYAPDVVHVASPFVLGVTGLRAARKLEIPSVAVFQTDVAGFARRHRAALAAPAAWRWIRRVHELADLTLAPSTSALADLREHGIPRTARWGRGVDTALFHPGRVAGAQRVRSELAAGGELLVGYVGRLAPEKRVERLAALRGLPGIRVVVVGDGPSRGSVERALGTLDRPPALLGRLQGDALADVYAALDIFVHTGTEETFGQTIQEAQASGVPVVAPASGGPLDLIEHGVTGLHYPPEDDAALREAVAGLSVDPLRRAELAAAGLARVAPRGWDRVGDELLEHYRSVMVGSQAFAA